MRRGDDVGDRVSGWQNVGDGQTDPADDVTDESTNKDEPIRAMTSWEPGIGFLQYDDSPETRYTRAQPILEPHNMVASPMTNPGDLGCEAGEASEDPASRSTDLPRRGGTSVATV